MTDDRPVLWHVPLSRSMRVLWLMKEIGCDHDLHELSFFDKSMRQPPYSEIHPVGRAPALQVDGVTLHESGACIEYLCETRARHLWRAPGEEGRSGWLDWLHFAETLGQHIAILTQQHIVLREDHMRSPVVMRLEAQRLSRALALVENRVKTQNWLMESGFSGIDCAVGWSVFIAARFVRFDDRPALAAYLARFQARPAFRASLPPAGTKVIYAQDFYEAPDA